MMLTPCWPSAGPTGGEGFALPAGIWSLTTAWTFFTWRHPSTRHSSESLHLVVLELDRGRPAEDRHGDLHPAALGIHVLDNALEVDERPDEDVPGEELLLGLALLLVPDLDDLLRRHQDAGDLVRHAEDLRA